MKFTISDLEFLQGSIEISGNREDIIRFLSDKIMWERTTYAIGEVDKMAKIKHHINKSKRIARSCKNNGSCSWCKDSRLHNSDKKKAEADFTVDDLFLDPTQDILPFLHFNMLEKFGKKSKWKDTFKW